MQVSAIAKRLQISPQKVRLVADQVRGKPVADALDILNFSTKKGAVLVKKTVESAIANAEHNEGVDVDDLRISEIYVNAGMTDEADSPSCKGTGR
jgi:large subunit ribosomal protein L22